MGEAQTGALVLVVEDQETISFTVRAALEHEGFAAHVETDGAQALAQIPLLQPALVLLDIGLPGMDGLSVLREVRRTTAIPVILLTSRDDEFDRVLGLELGADDYISKPFSRRELVARIRAVLRRTAGNNPPTDPGAAVGSTAAVSDQITVFGDLEIDVLSREVRVGGRTVDLTRREFDLLAVLSSAPRRVWSREQLLRGAWESSAEWQDPATVTEHIRRLRLKIETDPDSPRWIETVRGVGYRFLP